MTYEDIPLWKWCARTMDFKPSYAVPDTPFGKRPIVLLTPFWEFELTLPAKGMTERREIEALIHGSDGVPTFRVYDARVPYPAALGIVNDSQTPLGGIPNLSVMAMSKTSSTLTVQGRVNDVITVGDPLAFTFENRRYYFKAKNDLILTGGNDVLPVFMRPPGDTVNVNTIVERVRPTQAFNVRINDIEQGTGDDNLTRFTLSGTEYWGGV